MEKKIPTIEEARTYLEQVERFENPTNQRARQLIVYYIIKEMSLDTFTTKDIAKYSDCIENPQYASEALKGLRLCGAVEIIDKIKEFKDGVMLRFNLYKQHPEHSWEKGEDFIDWYKNKANDTDSGVEQECVSMLAQMIEQEEAKAEPVPQSKSQEQVKMDIGTDLTLKQACQLSGVEEKEFKKLAEKCGVKITEVSKPINKEYKHIVSVEGAFAVMKCKHNSETQDLEYGKKSVAGICRTLGWESVTDESAVNCDIAYLCDIAVDQLKHFENVGVQLEKDTKIYERKLIDVSKERDELKEKYKESRLAIDKIKLHLTPSTHSNTDYKDVVIKTCKDLGVAARFDESGVPTDECLVSCLIAGNNNLLEAYRNSANDNDKLKRVNESLRAEIYELKNATKADTNNKATNEDGDTAEVNNMLKALKKKWQGEALSDFKKRIGEVIG